MIDKVTDKGKLSLSTLLVATGVLVYVLPAHWLSANPQDSDRYRLMAIGVSFALALLVFWFTESRQRVVHLVHDAKNELMKVVWPTRSEAITYSISIIALSLIAATYSWGVDKIVELVVYQWLLK